MLHFVKSQLSKPKLVHNGHLYNQHKVKADGSILWRCEYNNTRYREKMMFCNSTASTTGTTPTSTLNWARDHSHPPNPARFPAAMWNVAGRHFTGSTRTTNALEVFHHSFNSLVACQHPSIWVLLKSLQRQQALTDDMFSHIAQ